MITYGLDSDLAHKVVKDDDFQFLTSFSDDYTKPIKFNNHALIGL